MDGSKTTRTEAFSNIYSFDQYFLNPEERRLARAGKYIDVKPRTYDVLTFLVANAGKPVNKDEILGTVWEDRFVEEGNLAVHVSRLRKMFRTTGGKNSIQTISGAGYQFVEPVEIVSKRAWKKAVAGAPPIFDPYAFDKDCESIAIMPLLNENGDPEIDYIADGLTEALINNLACRGSIRVLARNTVFQFKGDEIDIKEVGKRLNVANIVTGRIRMSNDNISLSVELARTSDGTQVWGDQYNRQFSEVFEMQDSITNSICENLNTELKRASGVLPLEHNAHSAESYRLLLKGRFFSQNRRAISDVAKAEKLFRQAITLDPGYAEAYIELANAIRIQFLYQKVTRTQLIQQTEQLLQQAYEINSHIPEYFLVRGYMAMFIDFDFSAAESHFQKAIKLNPGSARAHNYLARLKIYRGETALGLRIASKSACIDPVSYSNDKTLAKLFLMTHQFENAVLRLEECLELAPNDFESLVLLGFALTELGDFTRALHCYESALEIQDHDETVAMKGYTLALMGRKKKARELAAILFDRVNTGLVPNSFLAVIYSGLGDRDKTIELLNLAHQEFYLDLVALRVDPRWKNVRNDPRFQELIRSIGI